MTNDKSIPGHDDATARPCRDPGRTLWFEGIGEIFGGDTFDEKLAASFMGRTVVPPEDRVCPKCGARGTEVDLVPAGTARSRIWNCRAQDALARKGAKWQDKSKPGVRLPDETGQKPKLSPADATRMASGYTIGGATHGHAAVRMMAEQSLAEHQTMEYPVGSATPAILDLILRMPAVPFVLILHGKSASFDCRITEDHVLHLNGEGLVIEGKAISQIDTLLVRDLLDKIRDSAIDAARLRKIRQHMEAVARQEDGLLDGEKAVKEFPDVALIVKTMRPYSPELMVVNVILAAEEAAKSSAAGAAVMDPTAA